MSAPDRQSDRLPEQVESLLEGWPVPGRSALEWEDLANATVSRVRETTIGSTDDELLGPPLPKEEGEGELSANKPVERDMPVDEPRLLAIAQAAVADAASEESKDIARAGLMAAEHSKHSRPPAPPTSAAGHFRRGTPAGAASLQGHLPPSSVRPVQAVHEAQARSELPARPKEGAERPSSGVMIAGAMLALAAGVALYVAAHRAGPTAVALATSQESAQPAAPPAAAPQPAATTENAEEPAAKPHMLALDDLKPSETPSKVAEAAKVVVPTAGSSMSLVLRSKNVPTAAKTSDVGEAEPKQQAAVALNEPAEPAGGKESADEAAKQALPNHPSQGAILGAVGSVMLGARSCLAGQEEGSKVQVTFGSDGRVRTVSVVSGPAAGTPAEGCLRSALMGARVSPFSEPEYAASITVRPP